ncbi:ATP-binding protein [Bacteroides sp.]
MNYSCTIDDGPVRRIVVIHSYESSYAAYPDFNKMIEKAFREKGIIPEICTFYLDCESFREKEELKRIGAFLDSVAFWKPEVILVNDDQATYSLLKCEHRLAKRVPIVFAGVNYPNWELINLHHNVTGFHDKIDFKANIRVVQDLFGKEIALFSILDSTYLDRQILKDGREQLQGMKIAGRFSMDNEAAEAARKKTGGNGGYFYWTTVPARNSVKGGSLYWNLSKFTANRNYIQLKRDFTTINIGNISSNPSLTAINEAFGYGERLLGGYFTTLSTQVNEEVDAATRILNGTSVKTIPVVQSHKNFVVDWNVMKLWHIHKDRIPSNYIIMGIPFRESHFVLWLCLVIALLLLLTVLFVVLVVLYQREKKRKRVALRALADEKETLALAVEGGNMYAWKLVDGYFVFESDFWKFLDLQKRPISIKEMASFIHPDDKHRLEQELELFSVTPKKIIQLRCDFNRQGYQWWEFRYTISLLESGQKTAGLLLNIQAFKDREAELEEAKLLAEKAELKESFLANMSHEIRTPLNAIVGFSNLLATDEELGQEEKMEFVSVINQNNELLLKLVNDILELSRMESGQMVFSIGKYSVTELVDSVYTSHQLAVPSTLEFIKESDGSFPHIQVDKARLIQVLTNFLNNSVKFTRQGYIKLGYCLEPDGKHVQIYVEDSGIGISPEQQKMVFGRFYKQDEFAQGTGLGLSICQLIIEKLNGQITLWSEPGKGSRFTVILPCEVE